MVTTCIAAATLAVVCCLLLVAYKTPSMRAMDDMKRYWKQPEPATLPPTIAGISAVAYDEGVMAVIHRLHDEFGCPASDIWRILDTTDIALSPLGRRALELQGVLPEPISFPASQAQVRLA